MKKILFIALTAVLALSSCVKDEPYPYATVSGLTNTDAYSVADEVTVSAKVTALVNVTEVTLYYATDGKTFKSVAMTGSAGTYTGKIPGYEKGTTVTYYVAATTEAGVTATSAKNTYEVGKVPVDYTGLVLNELNGNDKFIELYNGGDHDIYLGDLRMYKDSNFETATWSGPSENLKKGEYMVLYSADLGLEIDAKYVFNSGLSAKKSVRITLLTADGKDVGSNKACDFNLNNDAGTKYAGSFGRNADGNWYHQTTKTPGEKNVDGTEPLTMKD